MSYDHDVIVVGCGPAGSTTAEHAARRGLSVLVLEKRKVIGVPVACGEFLPETAEIAATFPRATELDELFEVPDGLVSRRTEVIRMIAPSLRHWDVPFLGYTTERDRFDQHLAERARRAGAEVRTSVRVDGVEGTEVIMGEERLRAKVVVGADGPLSRVASALGFPRNQDMYPAVTGQAVGDFPPVLEMYFGGVAPGAYAWVIPKKDGANVGVGCAPRFSDGKVVDYYADFLRQRDLTVRTRTVGKLVPSNGPVSRTASENALLVGDAAGHVMAVNGGGIPIAMICGRLAGRAVADHVLDGVPLKRYEEEWRRQVAKPLHTAVNTKRMASLFFGTSRRTEWAMGVVGARRMGKMVRCRPVFP
jgi:digeranylgeranylglycerophospholipid reductase